jgi:hypothetical protein
VFNGKVPELDNQLRGVLKISGFILTGICLALVLYPGDSLLWGMAVGTAAGVLNSVFLALRIERLPELRPDAAKRHMKIGLTMRLCLIMAVLFFVAGRLPFVSLSGVGAGLLIPYSVSVIISVIETWRLYRQSNAFLKKYYGR